MKIDRFSCRQALRTENRWRSGAEHSELTEAAKLYSAMLRRVAAEEKAGADASAEGEALSEGMRTALKRLGVCNLGELLLRNASYGNAVDGLSRCVETRKPPPGAMLELLEGDDWEAGGEAMLLRKEAEHNAQLGILLTHFGRFRDARRYLSAALDLLKPFEHGTGHPLRDKFCRDPKYGHVARFGVVTARLGIVRFA